MNGDLSAVMFWAGAMMVFTPLIAAGVVLFVVWRGRREPPPPPPEPVGPTRPEP